MIELLGFLAGLLTTVAFVPQVWRTVRTRQTRDVSLATFSLFAGGVCCWLLYGVGVGSLPIIVANSVTLILALVIVVMKLRYG